MNESSKYEQLSAYLDGELSADERSRIEQWLADDADARRRLDELRAVSASLKGLATHRLDEDLSDRVLQAAEHRILSEPTSLTNAPRPAPEEPITPRNLARRLLSPRAVAWSGLAVAIAILLTVFPFDQPGVNRDIAKSPRKPASVDSVPSIIVAPEMPESIAKEERYGPSEGESFGTAGEMKKDRIEKRTPGHNAKRLSNWDADTPSDYKWIEPVTKGKATASKAVPRGYPGKAGYSISPEKPGVAKAIPKTDESARPTQAVRNRRDKSKKSDRQKEQDHFGWNLPSQMYRKGPPTTVDSLAAGTAIQRAVQNQSQSGLVVFNCAMTPEAIKKQAFTRTLYANSIDVVTIPADEQPLVEDLVRNQMQFAPQKAKFRRHELARKVKQKKGTPPLSKKQDITIETPEEALYEGVNSGNTFADQGGKQKVIADGPQVEVVLVEGSPEQIMATVSALGQRGDMFVSVEPQTPNTQWGHSIQAGKIDPELQLWIQQNAPKARSSSLAGQQFGMDKTSEDTVESTDSEQISQTQQKKISQKSLELGRTAQRGTAQRIGPVRLNRLPSFGDTRPPTDRKLTTLKGRAQKKAGVNSTPTNAPESEQVVVPQTVEPPTSQTTKASPPRPHSGLPQQDLPGLEPSSREQRQVGEKLKHSKNNKLDRDIDRSGGQLNDKPASPIIPPSGTMSQTVENKPEGEMQAEQQPAPQHHRGAQRGAQQIAQPVAQQPRLQVLFVLQKMPQAPASAEASQATREKADSRPAKPAK